jgi:hypothetical protein
MLPPWLEANRATIEPALSPIHLSHEAVV